MLVFSTVDARPSPESMKFPVFSLLAGNFGFRDGFARDCLLQRGVMYEPALTPLCHDLRRRGLAITTRIQKAVGDASSGQRIAKPLSPLRPLANCAWATISPTVGTLWKSPSTGRRPSSCLITKLPHCSMPVAIISTFWLPHSGHTSRARHSRTFSTRNPAGACLFTENMRTMRPTR